MARITGVVQIEKHHRLDGGIDQLLQATIGGAVRYLGVRETEAELICVCEETAKAEPADNLRHQKPDKTISGFISVPRRRTRPAGLADLIRAQPLIVHASRHEAVRDVWALQKDDRLARDREFRRKREWRVHEIATFVDGRFVARLSCRAPGALSHAPTQFVIEQSRLERDRVTVRSDYGSKSVGIAPGLLRGILERESLWMLPEMLVAVEDGWDLERDAVINFEHALQFEQVKSHRTFDTYNSVRQPGADHETKITVVETYDTERPAWLLSTSRGWYVMQTTGSAPHKVRFADRFHPEVAYDTPIATARILLKLARVEGVDEAQARQQFRQAVADDLRARLRHERFEAQWLLTARATLPDGRVALRATSLWKAVEAAPLEAPRPNWSILVITRFAKTVIAVEHDGVLDLATGKEVWCVADANSAQRFRAATALLGCAGHAAGHKTMVDEFLGQADGFTSCTAADAAWASLTEGAVVDEIEGDACPLPPAVRQIAINQAQADSRRQIEEMVAEGMAQSGELEEFDRRIAQARTWPPQLMALVADLVRGETVVDVSSGAEADCGLGLPAAIDGEPEMARDETSVDASASDGHQDEALETADATLRPHSKGGRPRLHEDDRARKREWAAKKRAEARAANGDAPVNKGGRPKVYASAAERKAAWRRRQQEKERQDL